MPEDADTAEPLPIAHTKISRKTLFLLLALGLVLIVGIGANAWQLYTGLRLSSMVSSLTSQIAQTKADTVNLTAQNNGTVAATAKSTLPAGQIGLASDKVIFTLPKGWVQAPLSDNASICSSGSVFANPVCNDIITLLPSALVNANKNTHYVYSPFEVDISVFEHTDSTNAKDWLSKDYGEDLEHTDEPQAINQSSAPINGYDGFTFISRYSDTPYPSTIFYSVIHGNYAVVIRSTFMTTVNPTGTAGNDVNEDYSKYLPDIKTLVNSITFHG